MIDHKQISRVIAKPAHLGQGHISVYLLGGLVFLGPNAEVSCEQRDKKITRPRMPRQDFLQTGRIDLWRGEGKKGNGVSIPTVCTLGRR